MWVKKYKLSVIGRVSSEDQMYSMRATANNMVLHTWKLLTLDLHLYHPPPQKKYYVSDEHVYFIGVGSYSATYMCIKSSCCTLIIYNYICQLINKCVGRGTNSWSLNSKALAIIRIPQNHLWNLLKIPPKSIFTVSGFGLKMFQVRSYLGLLAF